MNLQQLFDQFRIEAYDIALPPLHSDAELTTWFNEAQLEAALRKPLLRENNSVALMQFDIVANQRAYPLDSRVVEIVYADLVTKGYTGMIRWPLGITSAEELSSMRGANWRTVPFRPMSIIQYDDRVEVDCPPNAAYTIRCEGYRLPMWSMATDTVFTGSISTTVLTVLVMTHGTIAVGKVISGTGVTAGTTVTAIGAVVNGLQTYIVSASQTVATTTITQIGAVSEVLASGTLTIAGASGSVDTVLVNGLDVLGSSIAFITDLTTTAAAVVVQINTNQNRYLASSVGAVITLTDIVGTGVLHNGYTVSAATTTLTSSSTPFAGGIDAVVTTPEINSKHHRHLIKWALHRAYSKPYSETINPGKSASSLAEFEEYFGLRPDADNRKKQNRNNPHRNASYA